MTKEELKNYAKLDKECSDLAFRIEALEEKINSPRVQILSDMPKGTLRKDAADLIADLVDMKADYIRKYRKAVKELKRIEDAIDGIDNPTLRDLMRYKYIDGLKWEEVAVEMHYAWQHIHRLHAKALRQLCD